MISRGKRHEEQKRRLHEDAHYSMSGLAGLGAGALTQKALEKLPARTLLSTKEDSENARKLLVKMYGKQVGNLIADRAQSRNLMDGTLVPHPTETDKFIVFAKDLKDSRNRPLGASYLGLDQDSLPEDLQGTLEGVLNRTSDLDSPEVLLHELGHASSKGRLGKGIKGLELASNRYLGAIAKGAPFLILGSAGAARQVNSALDKNSTEESRDRAAVRAAIGAGALTTAASAPLLYEEGRANIRAMQIAKEFNEKLRKRKLLGSFATYAGLPLGLSVIPTAGVVLGARARKKKREKKKKRLEKKSSLLPFYARLAESQA